jgi:hypothetical protein
MISPPISFAFFRAYSLLPDAVGPTTTIRGILVIDFKIPFGF